MCSIPLSNLQDFLSAAAAGPAPKATAIKTATARQTIPLMSPSPQFVPAMDRRDQRRARNLFGDRYRSGSERLQNCDGCHSRSPAPHAPVEAPAPTANRRPRRSLVPTRDWVLGTGAKRAGGDPARRVVLRISYDPLIAITEITKLRYSYCGFRVRMADRVLKEGAIPPSAEPNGLFNLK